MLYSTFSFPHICFLMIIMRSVLNHQFFARNETMKRCKTKILDCFNRIPSFLQNWCYCISCSIVLILILILMAVIHGFAGFSCQSPISPPISPPIYHVVNNRRVNQNEVVIHGEDQYCDKGIEFHSVEVFGMYHTGTNAMVKWYSANCNGPIVDAFYKPWSSGTPLKWEHNQRPSISNRDNFDSWNFNKSMNLTRDSFEQSLFVVMIKDPLTWLASMKKHTYDLKMNDTSDSSWIKHPDCPRNISAMNGKAR